MTAGRSIQHPDDARRWGRGWRGRYLKVNYEIIKKGGKWKRQNNVKIKVTTNCDNLSNTRRKTIHNTSNVSLFPDYFKEKIT